MERNRIASIEHERELEQQRLDNEIQLRDILKQQVAELQQRESEVCSFLKKNIFLWLKKSQKCNCWEIFCNLPFHSNSDHESLLVVGK